MAAGSFRPGTKARDTLLAGQGARGALQPRAAAAQLHLQARAEQVLMQRWRTACAQRRGQGRQRLVCLWQVASGRRAACKRVMGHMRLVADGITGSVRSWRLSAMAQCTLRRCTSRMCVTNVSAVQSWPPLETCLAQQSGERASKRLQRTRRAKHLVDHVMVPNAHLRQRCACW